MTIKRFFALAFALVVLFLAEAQSIVDNPVAPSEAIVISGNARFTVLTPEMIRIEYSENARFEDRATFTVLNRKLDVPAFTKSEDDTFLYIETSNLKLKYRKGTDPRTVPASIVHLCLSAIHLELHRLSSTTLHVWHGHPDKLTWLG